MSDSEKLKKVLLILSEIDEAGEWPDDMYDRCGGNSDDAFSMGVDFGEELLAEKIRAAIGVD